MHTHLVGNTGTYVGVQCKILKILKDSIYSGTSLFQPHLGPEKVAEVARSQGKVIT